MFQTYKLSFTPNVTHNYPSYTYTPSFIQNVFTPFTYKFSFI